LLLLHVVVVSCYILLLGGYKIQNEKHREE
jgi:hypothetical protein